jgi:hypothetical protein
MDDDTTLINPSVPKDSAPIAKKDVRFNNVTRTTSNLFKRGDKNRQTQQIKNDLVQNYINKSDPETTSIYQKILTFLKTKK